MKNYKQILEALSDLEHQQWMTWSIKIKEDLDKVHQLIVNNQEYEARLLISKIRNRWMENWMPYKKLPEDVKDYDREWAEKVLELVPFKCPVYQCGGLMFTKERKRPKDFVEDKSYAGDEQTPNLICSNCKAIYQFVRFKNG